MPYVRDFYDEIVGLTLDRRPNNRGWVRFNCPACVEKTGKDDKRASAGLNTNTGGVNCFKCGLSGYLDGYGTGPSGAAQERNTAQDWEPVEQPPGFVFLDSSAGRRNTYRRARQYMFNRGVPAEMWGPLGIGVCDAGTYVGYDIEKIKVARRLNGRICVPVTESNGVWRGYVGRAYYDNAYRKYQNAPGNWREGCVWNPRALLLDDPDPVLVMEGLFDALPSYPNAIALLGKPTTFQLALLLASVRPVVMCLDGDAWRLSRAVAFKLHLLGQRVGFVKLPPERDPNDLDPTHLMTAARESVRTQKWRTEIH